jgi:hypothetical protein
MTTNINHTIKQIYLLIDINDYNELISNKELLLSFLDNSLIINEDYNNILNVSILSSIYCEIINNNNDIEIIDNKVKIILFNNYYNNIIISKSYISDECEYSMTIEYSEKTKHLFENIFVVYNINNDDTLEELSPANGRDNNDKYNKVKYITSESFLPQEIDIIDNKLILRNNSSDICYIINFSDDSLNNIELCDETKYLDCIIDKINILSNEFYLITNIKDINGFINNYIKKNKYDKYNVEYKISIDTNTFPYLNIIYLV